MTDDARFEDADEGPLRLRALDTDDLGVISAAVQDAVFPVSEMRWQKAKRRFALLVNRFRWERAGAPERVQCVLAFEDVSHVASQGVDKSDAEMVLSLLSLAWEPGDDGTGRCVLTLAGDGAIALEMEALEVTLTDVTKPYGAVSGQAPQHND